MKFCSTPSRGNPNTARAGDPVHWLDKALALGLLVLLAIVISCSGVAPQPPTAADDSGAPPFSRNETTEIAKGTPIYVRLQDSLSSATAETGDSFSAVLDEPLSIDGKTLVPEGAEISGRVIATRKSGQLHHAGYLRLTLSSVSMNGKQLPIQTTSVFVEGGSFGNHNVAYMGGGIGSNSLIGALTGGGKVINSNSSGNGGMAAAYTSGKNEVGFAADRRIGFRLIQSLNVSTSETTETR
jgi:hypothetical protein